MVTRHSMTPLLACLLTLPLATMSGCVTPPEMRLAQLEQSRVPRELDKAALPAYIVEPPDILVIQAVNMLRTPETPPPSRRPAADSTQEWIAHRRRRRRGNQSFAIQCRIAD